MPSSPPISITFQQYEYHSTYIYRLTAKIQIICIYKGQKIKTVNKRAYGKLHKFFPKKSLSEIMHF